MLNHPTLLVLSPAPPQLQSVCDTLSCSFSRWAPLSTVELSFFAYNTQNQVNSSGPSSPISGVLMTLSNTACFRNTSLLSFSIRREVFRSLRLRSQTTTAFLSFVAYGTIAWRSSQMASCLLKWWQALMPTPSKMPDSGKESVWNYIHAIGVFL